MERGEYISMNEHHCPGLIPDLDNYASLLNFLPILISHLPPLKTE